MKTHESSPFFLCQPDDRKGCAACCGIFNFIDIGPNHLIEYLSVGKQRRDDFVGGILTEDHTHPSVKNVRDITSHICPLAGFIKPGVPGCLVHEMVYGKDSRDMSLFGKKVCDNFKCPAYTILTDSEKEMLIRMVDDWYYYSIAIVDPVSFQWIVQTVEKYNPIDNEICKRLINEALQIHGEYLVKKTAPIFFYSTPEYKLSNSIFSLEEKKIENESEKKQIHELFSSITKSSGL